jgi:hypothetical protein
VVGGVACAAGYVLTWFAARFIPPASVEFGELRTFRDLARALSCEMRPDSPVGDGATDGH